MVRGLDVFREHFAGHADQFVLIGGTAASLALEEAGLDFRATKDPQLLAPDTRIPVAERIAQDLNRFLDAIETDRSIDPKSLKIGSNVGEIAERIARAFGLNRPRET